MDYNADYSATLIAQLNEEVSGLAILAETKTHEMLANPYAVGLGNFAAGALSFAAAAAEIAAAGAASGPVVSVLLPVSAALGVAGGAVAIGIGVARISFAVVGRPEPQELTRSIDLATGISDNIYSLFAAPIGTLLGGEPGTEFGIAAGKAFNLSTYAVGTLFSDVDADLWPMTNQLKNAVTTDWSPLLPNQGHERSNSSSGSSEKPPSRSGNQQAGNVQSANDQRKEEDAAAAGAREADREQQERDSQQKQASDKMKKMEKERNDLIAASQKLQEKSLDELRGRQQDERLAKAKREDARRAAEEAEAKQHDADAHEAAVQAQREADQRNQKGVDYQFATGRVRGMGHYGSIETEETPSSSGTGGSILP